MRRLAVLVAILAAFGLGTITHLDVLPDLATYGVSVGSSTSYCSWDFRAGVSCQSGR